MTFRLRSEQQQALAQSNVGNYLAAMLSSGPHSAHYDSEASRVRVVGARNQRAHIDLDARGNVLRLVSPLGRETRYHYEGGRQVAVQLPTGLTLRTHYDALGRVSKSERSDGESQQLIYDVQGNLAALRTGNGATLRLDFDPEQRLERTVERDGGEVRYCYDECGRLLEVTDPLGRRTRLAYGDSDEVERIEQPDGSRTAYTYGGADVLESVHEAAHAEFTRDERGKLTAAVYADGYGLSLVYGDAGRVVSATSADSHVELEYDAEGRVSAESQDGRLVRYAYDAEGRLAELTLPDGRSIAYQYDLDGRLSVARDWTGQQQRFHYAAAEHPLHRELPTGVVESYQLDSAGRITGIDLHNQHELCWSQRYRRDVVGRVIERADSRSGVCRYRYDVRGRLVGVEDGERGAAHESYTYDAVSQRVASHAGSVSFDAMCRPVQSGSSAYAYDALGNRVQVADPKGTARYVWTGPNLLREVISSSGTVVRYFYDAFGRRVRKQLANAMVTYIWAGNHLVQELHEDAVGVRTVEYLYFPGSHRPLAKCDDGRVYYYHCDQLGTPILLTDAAVRLVWSARYAAFGCASVEHQFVAQPLRLPGQYFDEETGLHYNRARYYDTALGVYLSRDPLAPAGENAYVYVGANPINAIDPLGLIFWEDAPGWVKTAATMTVGVVAGLAVGAALAAMLPAALAVTTLGAGMTLVVAGMVGGAAAGGLDAAMTKDGCVTCGMGKGALVGFAASLPFLFAPAGASLVIMAGFGMTSGAVGYVVDLKLSDGQFSWMALGDAVLLGAAFGAAAEFIGGKLGARGKGAPGKEPTGRTPSRDPVKGGEGKAAARLDEPNEVPQMTGLPKDVVEDPRGVYGYMPTEECSVRNMLDFSDPVQVAKAREARIQYLKDLEAKRVATDRYIQNERANGLSDEQIARELVDKRNADRMATYKDNPEGLSKMKARNAEKYGGRENGPDYDYLIEKGSTTEDIVYGTNRSNRAMDILLGLTEPKGGT